MQQSELDLEIALIYIIVLEKAESYNFKIFKN